MTFADMLSRAFSSRSILRASLNQFKAPSNGSRMARTVERDLPNPLVQKARMRNGFFIFAGVMGAAVFAMVKYEAANSPVVSSTLYTLRRSQKAEDAIGRHIRFASTMPWITGSPGFAMSRPEIDFTYEAVGSEGSATVHFHARRSPNDAKFRAVEWELILKDGTRVNLLDEEFHPLVPGHDEDPGMQRA